MRWLAILLVPASASADVSAGASIGAGAQGASGYSALELRFDATWPDVHVGLGARGVWDGDTFRRSDWATPWHVLTIIRDVSASTEVDDTQLGVVAGGLAPAHVGHVVDGYRAALDDRWRTGVRAAAANDVLDVDLELDDVLDPVLVAGGARWFMAPPWGVHTTIAVDPSAPAMRGTQHPVVVEAGLDRRFEADRARLDSGVSVVAELGLGASLVAFADAAAECYGVTWSARADLRVGTGSAGSLFGPLYRIERLAHDGRASLWDRARGGELSGAGAGVTLGARAPLGWIELGARARPGLGPLVVASGGMPLYRSVQAGVWAAVGESDAAGAAEVRVAWLNNTVFSALQVARVYRLDEMDPFAVWSVTAWFGATTE